VILYIDNEQSLDEGDKLIVDGLEVDALISRCDTVDELFDIMERVLTTVNTVSEGSEKPVFVVVVVDTIAGTSTKAEMEAEWGTVDYPRAPRALREGFRKMTRKINRHNVLMICTNQVGENFKGPKKRNLNPFAQDLPRPEDFQSSGGRAIKFFASLRIFMFPVNQEFKLSRGNQGPSGFVGGFITVKNRQVKPRREGRFVLLYDGGLNNIFSILETMMKCKTVTRGERGIIEFRFRAHGIETTTFPDQRPNTNPKIEGNAAWPAFYEAHRPDLDLLWQKTVDLTFNEVTTSEDSEDNE
jgi:RecA/RadA recombinase